MPLYFRCKTCGAEHLSPIVFPDRRSFTRTHLTRNLFICPESNAAARYDRADLYWRTDLPIATRTPDPTSPLRANPSISGRILIVDDEESLVWALEKLLQQAGYTEIATTTDPREALALFEAFRPDIVLLDLQMPYVDGYAVLRAVRARVASDPYFPILLLTGEVQQEAKHRALLEGAKDFLSKPFESLSVLLRVGSLLETRALYQRLAQQAQLLEQRMMDEDRHSSAGSESRAGLVPIATVRP